MSTESLDEVRKRISRKYLGKAGIHGVGIRRKQQAICLYLSITADSRQKELLEKIQRETTPYKVLQIEEEQPKIT